MVDCSSCPLSVDADPPPKMSVERVLERPSWEQVWTRAGGFIVYFAYRMLGYNMVRPQLSWEKDLRQWFSTCDPLYDRPLCDPPTPIASTNPLCSTLHITY